MPGGHHGSSVLGRPHEPSTVRSGDRLKTHPEFLPGIYRNISDSRRLKTLLSLTFNTSLYRDQAVGPCKTESKSPTTLSVQNSSIRPSPDQTTPRHPENWRFPQSRRPPRRPPGPLRSLRSGRRSAPPPEISRRTDRPRSRCSRRSGRCWSPWRTGRRTVVNSRVTYRIGCRVMQKIAKKLRSSWLIWFSDN